MADDHSDDDTATAALRGIEHELGQIAGRPCGDDQMHGLEGLAVSLAGEELAGPVGPMIDKAGTGVSAAISDLADAVREMAAEMRGIADAIKVSGDRP